MELLQSYTEPSIFVLFYLQLMDDDKVVAMRYCIA